jgi:hypothetical protein
LHLDLHVEFFSYLAYDCLLLGFTGFHFAARKLPFLGNVGEFGGAALHGEDFVLVLDDGGYDLDAFHGHKDNLFCSYFSDAINKPHSRLVIF